MLTNAYTKTNIILKSKSFLKKKNNDINLKSTTEWRLQNWTYVIRLLLKKSELEFDEVKANVCNWMALWEEVSLDLHLNSCRKIKSKYTRKIKDKAIILGKTNKQITQQQKTLRLFERPLVK